jgi:uncharacterized protein with PIN domain
MTKPKKPMTAAERQAASRLRRALEGDAVSLMVHPVVPGVLKRISAHTGESRADILQRLLQSAESDIVNAIKGQRGAEKKYYAE